MSNLLLYISILLLGCFPYSASAQDLDTMLATAQAYEKNLKEEDALKEYQQILKFHPTNITAFIKCSELCSLVGNRFSEKKVKSAYFNAARKYASAALKLNPNNAEANFVMAMAMGRLALIESGKHRVEAVNEIKKYAEICIQLDPKNYKGYHVLGKWHFEVSRLNSIERTAVKVFFGGIPESSFEKSIFYYEKSAAYAPHFILNYLELARVHHANHQKEKAFALLKKLESMPSIAADDPRVKEEGRKLMDQWKK